MNELYGIDCSQFQGTINWDQLNAAANFAIIRAAYGTITDPYFAANQQGARRVRASAGPLGVGYYYYAYPTLLDPVTSANYFVDTVGDLQDGEVLALDLEGNVGPEPVAWSLAFLQAVESRTGVKPLVYLNQSEVSGYNWQPVYSAGFGLWLADYNGDKTSSSPATPWPFVAMRQWTSSDVVSGVAGKVDGDTFYGTFDEFYKYGYSAPSSTPLPPQPAPPSSEPTSTPVDTVTIPPAPTPAPSGSGSTATAIPVKIATPSPSVPDQGSSQPSTQPVKPVPSPAADQATSPLFSTTVGRFLVGLVATGLTPLIMNLQNFHTNDTGLATAIAGGVTVLMATRDLLNSNITNTPNSKS
jgi:GH25 family lysozyme M1 (1,4-beta-N-acetylmuramidase)